MEKLKMPHSLHNRHLCHLVNLGFHERDQKKYKRLVREPKCFCKSCARVARKGKNLCYPEKL